MAGCESLFVFFRDLWRFFRCKHEWEDAYDPYGDRFLMCDKCKWAKWAK